MLTNDMETKRLVLRSTREGQLPQAGDGHRLSRIHLAAGYGVKCRSGQQPALVFFPRL